MVWTSISEWGVEEGFTALTPNLTTGPLPSWSQLDMAFLPGILDSSLAG